MLTQVDWSIPLFRFRGIAVRADWTLFLIVIYDLVQYLRGGYPWWFALAIILCLFTSILLHEFGHSLAARAVGGDSRRIVLWMLGGLAECEVPARPGATFLVAAAGPLVSAVLAGLGYAMAYGLQRIPDAQLDWAIWIVQYLGWLNLRLVLFNLIPAFPLDGGRMFGAAMWALIGPHRAQRAVLYVSIPSVLGLFAWTLWSGNFLGLFIGFWIVSGLVVDYHRMRQGESHAFGIEAWGSASSGMGWLQRWRQRRRAQAAERQEQQEAAEQEILDRLLAKVTEQGLPSLTAAERAQLDRISKRQRERQGGR